MQFKRADRVAALLREEISKIVEFELSDPRLGFVTVTGVDVTDDLRHAKVYCGILGDAATVAKSLEALTESAWRIRKVLAGRVNLRRAPEITFHLDERAEKAARIDTLLRKIHEGEAAAGAARAEGDRERGAIEEDDEDSENLDDDESEIEDEDENEDTGEHDEDDDEEGGGDDEDDAKP